MQGPCQSPEVACSSEATLCKHTPGSGVLSRSGTPRLADLHRVQTITAWPLATTPPPSFLPHTGIFVSYNVGDAVWEFPSSSTTDKQQPVAASSTPGARGDNAYQRSDLISPAPSHFGSGVCQPLSPRRHHDASNRGFFRQHRSQDSSGQPRVARRCSPFLHRLQTPDVANLWRLLHSPHTVVHVWFFARTICCTVKGRTRTPAFSCCRKRERSGRCRQSAVRRC